ncbi:phage tail protein [Ruoffia sp. FAM 24228]
MEFSFLPNNPAATLMELNKTRIRVLRLKDNAIIFEGYVNQYNGAINTDNQTEISYSADEITGVLTHSDQPKFSFKGKVSDFVKKLLDYHNTQVEPWKQFQLGRCEVDTYTVYPDDETPVNQELSIGDKATIKQTAKYIWNSDGVRLNIASSVLGVTHTVEVVGTSGVFAGKYLLRHPNSAWGISGWIQAEDIVEFYSYENTQTIMNTSSNTANKIIKVTIKKDATVYYWDSYTNNPTNIPSFVKSATDLTINKDQYRNNRYALYRQGQVIAWIHEQDILMGGQVINPPSVDKPNSIQKTRIIEVEVEYGNTWDNLIQHVIEKIGGEIVWRLDEGIYTLDILNKYGEDSDLPIASEFNLQEIQEMIDATDIVTKVRAIGRRPTEEASTTAARELNNVASTLGRQSEPIAHLGVGD